MTLMLSTFASGTLALPGVGDITMLAPAVLPAPSDLLFFVTASETAEITATASGAISALRLVSHAGAEVALTDPASVASLALIAGITLNAAASGAAVTVRRTGTVEDPSWSWNPGAAIFCGAAGVLTQTPPATVALRQVAVAVTPTLLKLDLSDLFIL